ncbi:MAG: trehalose-6-phosphate synthase [Ilumatobacteraceae bacterium]
MDENLPGTSHLVVVSSRLPVELDDRESWRRAPGGLVSVLEPVLRDRPATWLGFLEAHADPPPEKVVGFELAAVPISPIERKFALDGYCNQTLWPALHGLDDHVEEDASWRRSYEFVQERTAHAIDRVAAPGAAVWLHDYQVYGVGRHLARLRPDLVVGLFCHTPVAARSLAHLRSGRAVAEDLRAMHFIGTQTAEDAESIRTFLGSGDPHGGRVRAMPVGFDGARWLGYRTDPVVTAMATRYRGATGVTAVGVDRVDYTKGLLHKLNAVEYLLTSGTVTPDEFRLVQIAVPSRTGVPVYRYLNGQLEATARRINGTFRRTDGKLVVELIRRQLPQREVAAVMRAGDLALITPVRDGMNLVALEFATLNGDRRAPW